MVNQRCTWQSHRIHPSLLCFHELIGTRFYHPCWVKLKSDETWMWLLLLYVGCQEASAVVPFTESFTVAITGSALRCFWVEGGNGERCHGQFGCSPGNKETLRRCGIGWSSMPARSFVWITRAFFFFFLARWGNACSKPLNKIDDPTESFLEEVDTVVSEYGGQVANISIKTDFHFARKQTPLGGTECTGGCLNQFGNENAVCSFNPVVITLLWWPK